MSRTESNLLSRRTTAVVALATGWGVMAAEMGLVRLVTPYLGASLPIWASVIALVLVALAVGAVLGGRLSRGRFVAPALVLLLATAGLVLAVAPAALRWMLEGIVRFRGASLVATGAGLVLFAGFPLLLAGAVAPLLVQVRARGWARAPGQASAPTSAPISAPASDAMGVETPGSAAGLVTAGSTVGSLLGTLIPAFFALPYLGTSRTFLLAALPLLGCALWIHRVTRQAGGVGPGAAALALLVIGGALAPTPLVHRRPGTVATAESAHHHIAVVRRPEGHLVLLLDAGYAEQSYYDSTQRLFYGPWPVMAAGPLFARATMAPTAPSPGPPPAPPPGRKPSDSNLHPWEVLILGLGGGTAARMIVRAFPRARVTGAELDGEILRMAKRHLGLDHPRIQTRVADGRLVLRQRANADLDVLLVDAAHHLLVPFHLVTAELFDLARRKLRPGGVVVVNLARLANDTALLDAVAYTGSRTFAHVYRLDVSGGANTLLIFVDHALHAENLAPRAATMAPSGLARFVTLNVAALTAWKPSGASPELLTDDRAPVAPLVLSMVWRHAMGGE